MELGSPPVSQPCGWFQGREETFSGSVVLHPINPKASEASTISKAHGGLEKTRFTTRDERG